MKNVSGKILKNGRGRILKDDNCFMKIKLNKLESCEMWNAKPKKKFFFGKEREGERQNSEKMLVAKFWKMLEANFWR